GPGQVRGVLLVEAGVGVALPGELGERRAPENAELEHVELAPARHPALPEEPRPAVARDEEHVEPDQEYGGEQQGHGEEEQKRGDHAVEESLRERVGNVDGGRVAVRRPGQTCHPYAPRSRPVIRTVSWLLLT